MPSPRNESGLSVPTLVISSVASLVAAIVVREIWGPGAIIGAAMTPVIVAVVSETLNRPTRRVGSLAAERRTRTGVQRRTPGGTQVAPPPELERPDPFGIWQDERRGGLSSRRVKLGIVTGLIAFAIVAVLLTSSELVFGGSVAGGSKTTLLGGKKKSSGSRAGDDRNTSTSTQPQTTPLDAPTTTTAPTTPTTPITPAAPTTTTPAPTTTAPPPAATTPGTTTPPAGGEQAPPG